jgi:hypothetical protein
VHGEQEGKASYSGAVATFLELELGCGQPDSHSNYGFQDLDRLNYCAIRTNRTPDEWNNWCLARNRMDEELKQYYRACTTGELPAQLLALSKKLDEELLKKQDR